MSNILKIKDIAKDLGKSKRTILTWVENGKLPAHKISRSSGYEYGIYSSDYYKWKESRLQIEKKNEILTDRKSLEKQIKDWINWCRKGLLTGKPQSELTIEVNTRYLNYYFDKIPRRFNKSPIISVENLREVLGDIEPTGFSRKDNIYKAIRSFTKYLILNNMANDSLLNELNKAKPKRSIPPKQLHCTQEQFMRLLEEAGKKHHCQSSYDVELSKTIIATLGYAGLRASELCNLRMQDVNLKERSIFVYLGKGNKNRIIGICSSLYDYLLEYLKVRPESKLDTFFLTRSSLGRELVPYTKDTLGKKIRRLSKITGIEISAHGLRRTFATVAANAGKPINMISMALGHSDIKTTQGYLKTTQGELVSAMKGW